MSFTYSGNPGSSKLDFVRFAIGDTSNVHPLLQDEEITYLISVAKSDSNLLALAFRQAATTVGIRTVKRSLGPQSEDGTKRLEYYIAMASKYEKDLMYAGVPPLPEYAAEKVFDKNMMINDV